MSSFSEIFKSASPESSSTPDVRLIDYTLRKCLDPDMASLLAIIDVSTNEKYTYAELLQQVKRVAFGLHQRGFKKGDVISLLTTNSPAVIFAQLGILYMGGVLGSITTSNTPEEVSHQLHNSNTVAMITSEIYEQKVLDAIKLQPNYEVKVFVIGKPKDTVTCIPFKDLLAIEGDIPEFEVDLKEDVISLIYSSGTTDRPKGIMHTNKSLLGFTGFSSQLDSFYGKGSVFPCTLPLHYGSGMGMISSGFANGGLLITFETFTLPLLLRVVAQYKVSDLFYTPHLQVPTWPAIAAEHKLDLSCVKMMRCAGAPLNKVAEKILLATLKKVCPDIQTCQLYASTEMGLVSCRTDQTKFGSSGKLLNKVELKFQHIDNLSSPQIPNARHCGRIFVKTCSMMKGYLNNEEKTKSVLSEDGWYDSGDVGYMDNEGELYVLNRTSELINYKNKLFFPIDWESVFVSHAAVKDIAIVADNVDNGQTPVPFVILNQGFVQEENTGAKILEEINAKLPEEMKIERSIIFVDSIPRTNIGKILRRILVQHFESK